MKLVAIFLAGVAAGVGCAAAVDGADDPVGLIERHTAAFNAHDAGAVAANVAEDFVWYAVGRDQTVVEVEGRDGLSAGLADYFAAVEGVRSEMRDSLSIGPYVAVVERVSWRANGEPRDQAALAVYQVEAGKIDRVWYFPAVR